MKSQHQIELKKRYSEISDETIEAGPSTSFYKNCVHCNEMILKKNWSHHERSTLHKEKVLKEKYTHFKVINQAFQNRIETLVFKNQDEGNIIPEVFLKEAVDHLEKLFESYLNIHQAVKYNIELFALYIQINKEDDEKSVLDIKHFQTKMVPIFHINDFKNSYQVKMYDILKKMEEFQERDSNWALVSLLRLEININKYQPLKGSTYIPLPKILENKKACINIQNSDMYCFKWAIISALSTVEHSYRPSSYNVDNIECDDISINEWDLSFRGLHFPLKIDDTKKFEMMNPRISINIFGFDQEENLIIGPYYKTKVLKEKHINLLYIQDDSGENAHYVWIKNMTR